MQLQQRANEATKIIEQLQGDLTSKQYDELLFWLQKLGYISKGRKLQPDYPKTKPICQCDDGYP